MSEGRVEDLLKKPITTLAPPLEPEKPEENPIEAVVLLLQLKRWQNLLWLMKMMIGRNL